MKPLKLTMQAFGPFAGKEELCFADLGDNPLFLINGPTGSGKTTLLDAMCLALYNTTTGDERQGNEMRCNQAEPDELTFVEFDFELAGVAYRIRRIPEQYRPSQRGDKLVRQAPKATLYRLGENLTEESGELLVETKVNEANAYIERLTGLSGEQFRQVMVLPQGEFRKLLLADSKDREKIFASLFSTGIYSRLEDALKEQARGVKQAVQDQRNQLKGILTTGDVDSFENLEQGVVEQSEQLATAAVEQKAASKVWTAADKALLVANELEEAFTRLAQSRERAAQLKAQADQYTDKRKQLNAATEAETLAPVLNARQLVARHQQEAITAKALAAGQLASSEAALTDAVVALEAVTQSQPVLEAARARLVELDGFRAKSTILADAITAHNQALGERETVDAALASAVGKDNATVAAITKQEKQLQEHQKALEPLAAKPVELARLTPLLESRRQMAVTSQELADAHTALEQATDKSTSAEVARDAAKVTLDSVQLAWHRGQAALLAAELETGQPCPVCGSEEHPELAQHGEDMVKQEDVEQADQDYQSAVANAQRAQTTCESLVADIKRLDKALAGLSATLGELAMRKVEAVERDVATIEADVVRLEELKGEIQTSTQGLQRGKALAVTAADARKAAAAAAQAAAVQVAGTEAAKTAAESALPAEFRTADALESALTQVSDEITGLEAALASAEQAHNKAVNAKGVRESELMRADKDVLKSETAHTQAANDYAEVLATSSFNTEQECALASMPTEARTQLQQKIATYDADCNALGATLKAQEAQVKGKERLDLAVLQEATAVALVEKERLDGICSALKNALHTMEQVRRNYNAASAAAERLEAEYAVVGTLDEVANGRTGNKISLQRFVLGVLLDDVLIQATQRLTTMSGGRYQLVRKGEKAKGGGASGLDLMVYDDHSGTERSVATLSGGESFMAALSLALGLSDVVQGYAGGIRLDMLFVDEGFGSLDSESLDLAIRTLIDLQESGRMVGVISHVAELKEQMEVRVDVEKGLKGSHLKVMSPELAMVS